MLRCEGLARNTKVDQAIDQILQEQPDLTSLRFLEDALV